MDRQTITLAQSLENEVSESNSLVNDIYYQNIKKYDCENVQFKTVMTQKISNESNRIYSISLYDMNGNRVWSFGESSSGFDTQQSWFENAKKNTETIQYGHRHLVKSDLSGYVMDISRYVEYINAGNIKIRYFIDAVLYRAYRRYSVTLSEPEVSLLLFNGRI